MGIHFLMELDVAIATALSFETIKDFRAAHPRAYDAIHRNGLKEEVFAHMRRIRVTQDQYAKGRHCGTCKRHRPIERFLKVGRNSTARRSMCIDCHNEKSNAWRNANLERSREIVSQSAKRNPETGRRMRLLSRKRYPEAHSALFEPGMSWDNRGEWHIDHIKPVCIFIREGETDPAVINALSNLRPLWAEENLSRFRRNWAGD